MSPLLLLASTVLSPAYAKPVKPSGEAELTGVVEVPLYAGLAGDDRTSYVEATVGDQKLLLRLASAQYDSWVTAAAAGRLGLKASGKEGDKKAKIDEVVLGAARLSGVTVRVVDSMTGSGGLPVDGVLALPGFPDLAWAVAPSAGVLRLASGADGAALVAAVGSPNQGYDFAKRTRKVNVGAEKREIQASTLVVPVKWSGVEVKAALQIEAGGTWLAREVEGVDWYTVKKSHTTPVTLPPAPSEKSTERPVEWREVSIAGTSTYTSVDRIGQGPAWALDGVVNAQVGNEVLVGMDLAVDPNTHTWSIAPAAASKKADYSPAYEARLRAALEPKPGKDGAAPDDDAKKAARTGGLGPLADFLELRGRFDEAIAARKELATLSPDDCAAWTSLGSTLVAAGQPAGAVEPLTKASALYQPWAALSLDERTEIADGKAKAEKAKKEWTGQIPQSHACHVAPGLLATAKLQAGDRAGIASMYPAQLDLDAGLPLAAGNAALLDGKYDAAQAAYLQALKLSNGHHDAARVGLYLAMAPRDFSAARLQLEALRLKVDGRTDPMLVRLYTEGLRQSEGATSVLRALDTLLAADPSDALLLAQRSRERAAAGDADGSAKDWQAAKNAFGSALAARPTDAATWAAWATALAGAGQAAEAKQAADTAVKLAPGSSMAWLAMADAEGAAGDAAKAGESLKHAGVLGASNPGYALLLAR